MGKSGNPAKRATEQLQVSSIKDFKKKQGGVFQLPSGLVMKLRNPGGLKIFLAEGVIPNSLMHIVNNALEGGKKLEADQLKDGEGNLDPEMLASMTVLLDRVIVKCAVSPTVEPTPEDEADRSDDQLYADEIPDDDKMFVFQWVTGGTSDLATFRKRHQESVADITGS